MFVLWPVFGVTLGLVVGAHLSTPFECILNRDLRTHTWIYRVSGLCTEIWNVTVVTRDCAFYAHIPVHRSKSLWTMNFVWICTEILNLLRGELGVRWVVWLLYNASGSCNWWLVVCGRCVVDLGLSSVIVCLLVVNWMSVEIAWLARWFFFLLLYFEFACAWHCPHRVLGLGSYFVFWIDVTFHVYDTFHDIFRRWLGSVWVTGNFFWVLQLRPLFWCLDSKFCRDVSPGP